MTADAKLVEAIQQTVGSILTFSTEPQALINEVRTLVDSFSPTADVHLKFIGLQNYLWHPETYLEPSSVITHGEFKFTVISKITQCIEDAAAKVKVSAHDLPWNQELAMASVKSENDFTLIFAKKERKSVGFLDPQALPNDSTTYKAELYLSARGLNLQVDIKAPGGPYVEDICLSTDLMHFATKQQEELYFQSSLESAQRAALEVAAIRIYRLFKPEDTVFSLSSTKQKLLTHEFFLSALTRKQIDINLIETITDEQATMLLHPTIVNLLKKDILKIHIILIFTLIDFQLLTHDYYSELVEKYHHVLMQLTGLSSDQYQIMTLPIIIAQIKDDKLPIEIAKSLPAYLIPLFTDPFYSQKFAKQAPDWRRIANISAEFCEFLLEHDVISYLKQFEVSTDDMLAIADVLWATKANPTLALSNEQIKHALSVIDKNVYLRLWINVKLITLHDVAKLPLEEVLALGLARRAILIYQQTPVTLTSTEDTIHLISTDGKTQIGNGTATNRLKELTLYHLLSNLSHDLQIRYKETLNPIARSIYQQFHTQLENANKLSNISSTDTFWQDTFSTLIKNAKKELEKIPRVPVSIGSQLNFPRFHQKAEIPEIEKVRQFLNAIIATENLFQNPGYQNDWSSSYNRTYN